MTEQTEKKEKIAGHKENIDINGYYEVKSYNPPTCTFFFF